MDREKEILKSLELLKISSCVILLILLSMCIYLANKLG